MLDRSAAMARTRVIETALQQVMDRAVTSARRLTQGGKALDAFQVHGERLAYRATEVRAIQDTLHYVEALGANGQDDTLVANMALSYAADVGRKVLAEVDSQLDAYGLSETFVQQTLATPEVRKALRAGSADALVVDIGQQVLASGGINTCWLGDEIAEMTRQSVRDFARQEIEPIAERIHREDALTPDA